MQNKCFRVPFKFYKLDLNQANEILSDPNERTWYDSHKNNILQGSMSAEDYETQITYGFNIWTYF